MADTKPFNRSIDLQKNEIQNSVFHKLVTAPSSPAEGQAYYNTTDKKVYYHNGTEFESFAGDLSSIADNGGGTISVTSGTGGDATIGVADGGISTVKIIDSNITTAKLANNSVTAAKLANKYAAAFASSDWSSGDLVITAATHGVGATEDLVVTVKDSDGEDVTSGIQVITAATGNVTLSITAGLEFAGRIIIRN